MLIREILNTQVPIEIEEGAGEFITKANIGGRTYQFRAGTSDNPNNWECEFLEFSHDGHSTTSKTGNGNEFEVFSFVKRSIEMLIQKYKPKNIFFQSSKQDENRTKLYLRMLNKFKVLNYTHSVGDLGDDDIFCLKRTVGDLSSGDDTTL